MGPPLTTILAFWVAKLVAIDKREVRGNNWPSPPLESFLKEIV
jgi:hypothetical protein